MTVLTMGHTIPLTHDNETASMPTNGLWTTKELANAYGCDDSYLRQILTDPDNDRVTGVKVGNLWLIPDDEAQRFLDSKSTPRGPKPKRKRKK